jgi:UPF0716 protein FxsA
MGLGRLIFAAFIIVPIIEIAIFVWIGGLVGIWWTLGGVLLTAIAGSVLLRWQGARIWSRINAALRQGAFPAREIVDGVMIAIAGVLLLTPGYFTDLLGLLLFVPALRLSVFRFLRRRVSIVAGPAPFRRDGEAIDLDSGEWRDETERGFR